MIAEINKAWSWRGFNATEIIRTNEFGNIIFKTDQANYWRICPEEMKCEKIADTEPELNDLLANPEFIEDWKMTKLVELAKSELGELKESEKYCLKLTAVIGGEYEKSNLGIISFSELIAFSGDFGFQIKDIKDGQEFNLDLTDD